MFVACIQGVIEEAYIAITIIQSSDVSPFFSLLYGCSIACNILTLSSSGASAIVQIEILQQIEKCSGQKVVDIFQWVVASGFGALFFLLIVYGKCV